MKPKLKSIVIFILYFSVNFQMGACEVDDRGRPLVAGVGSSKHVSFDSSSLLRSHTVTVMDEASFTRSQTTTMVQVDSLNNGFFGH